MHGIHHLIGLDSVLVEQLLGSFPFRIEIGPIRFALFVDEQKGNSPFEEGCLFGFMNFIFPVVILFNLFGFCDFFKQLPAAEYVFYLPFVYPGQIIDDVIGGLIWSFVILYLR